MLKTGCYVLEVLEYSIHMVDKDEWSCGIKHLGYMKKRFKNKKDAVAYYDKHNPHMRSLNAHNTYESDWDPVTKLFYIVRDDYLIDATIDGFE